MNSEQINGSGRQQYWESHYRTANVPQIPSQFAVFTYNELGNCDCILDIGCGTGRDSFFFAANGVWTLGLDQSQAAVDHCNRRQAAAGLQNVQFHCGSVSDQSCSQRLEEKINGRALSGSIAIYARFFLHAITDDEEIEFLKLASRMIGSRVGHLALEFRTTRDRMQTKVTPDHFRRFVNPARFINRTQSLGFELEYFVEGFGYAKYKEDDAHVARSIFRKIA